MNTSPTSCQKHEINYIMTLVAPQNSKELSWNLTKALPIYTPAF
jgi:hypothetical protein